MTGASDLARMAYKLGGEVVGQSISCPGPGRPARDRSLSVRLSALTDDGLAIHSHHGDHPVLCRRHVRARLGWDRLPRPGEELTP